jgi:predicted ATPase
MLRVLHIDSFKAYVDVRVPLCPVTVIIGPNGSGKTSVLQAVEFLGALVRGTLKEHLDHRGWAYADLPHLRAANKQFGFTADLQLGGGEYEWLLRMGPRRRPGVAAERVTSLSNGRLLMDRTGRRMSRFDHQSGADERVMQTLTSSWLATVQADDSDRFPELLRIADWARRIPAYVALDPARLREPWRRTDEGIGPGGERLAGFLGWLKRTQPKRFNDVISRVKKVYPPLVGVTVKQGSYGWNRIEVSERWDGETVTLNAKQVSDGLLRLLAVSAMHEVPSTPSVVMFDEIENGVHPHLLGALITMLGSLASKGRCQVIATTHSPIVLNHIDDPAQILVAHRRKGNAMLTPLSETAGYRALGQHFDLGELWYNLGEQHLFRRPSHR